MPRGGRRAGKPGAAYTNRTDLNQAPRAATGQTYGEAGAQLEAQRAMPLPKMGGLPTATPAPAATGAGVQPGTLTPLDAPTQRPDEPVTHGLPTGPGAGPEALNTVALQQQNLSGLLNSLAGQSSTIAELAAYVNSGRL